MSDRAECSRAHERCQWQFRDYQKPGGHAAKGASSKDLRKGMHDTTPSTLGPRDARPSGLFLLNRRTAIHANTSWLLRTFGDLVHRSHMATGEKREAHSKIIVNQRKNELSSGVHQKWLRAHILIQSVGGALHLPTVSGCSDAGCPGRPVADTHSFMPGSRPIIRTTVC